MSNRKYTSKADKSVVEAQRLIMQPALAGMRQDLAAVSARAEAIERNKKAIELNAQIALERSVKTEQIQAGLSRELELIRIQVRGMRQEVTALERKLRELDEKDSTWRASLLERMSRYEDAIR